MAVNFGGLVGPLIMVALYIADSQTRKCTTIPVLFAAFLSYNTGDKKNTGERSVDNGQVFTHATGGES